MAKSYLIEYVRNLVEKGYSYEAIRNYLIQQGNPKTEVDSAINSHYQELELKEQAYVQQLVFHIQKGMNQGYSKDWMRSQLIQQGISTRFIDNAFDIIEKPKRKFDISPIMQNKAVLLILFLTIGGFSLFFLKNLLPEPTLLDITASAITTEVEAGKEFVFSYDVVSQGTRQKYDIFLDYHIIDPQTKEIIVRGKETFAISTTLSKVRRLLIPKTTRTGDYELIVVASYDDKIAKTSLMFKVSGETVMEFPEDIDEKFVEDEIMGEISDDRFGDGIIIIEYEVDLPEKPKPETYVETISTNEIMDAKERAADLAKTNPNQAIQICDQLFTGYREECLINVARISKDMNICTSLQDTETKDSCYFTLATFNGDQVACSLVTDSNLKTSCESLAKLKTMNITDSE